MRSPSHLALFLLTFSLGCASAGAWTYTPRTTQLVGVPLSKARVAVLPFEDRRGSKNSNTIWLYLIPIVPVGPFEYEKIEGGAGFLTHAAYQIRPREDLANAVVSELEAANLFAEVFYTEREHQPDVDLFVSGYVTDMVYKGGIISYGLSFYGPALWFLGLPAGYTTNSLSVGLELRTPTGEVLWDATHPRGERKLTTGLYYNWGEEFDGYPELMAEATQHWVTDLSTFIRNHPELLESKAP